jgi:hypothetical protein
VWGIRCSHGNGLGSYADFRGLTNFKPLEVVQHLTTCKSTLQLDYYRLLADWVRRDQQEVKGLASGRHYTIGRSAIGFHGRQLV